MGRNDDLFRWGKTNWLIDDGRVCITGKNIIEITYKILIFVGKRYEGRNRYYHKDIIAPKRRLGDKEEASRFCPKPT